MKGLLWGCRSSIPRCLGISMNFWKEHTTLRGILIAIFFVLGMILTVAGWKMTSKLEGLGLMFVGIILLLTALFVYNAPYSK